MKQPAAMPTMYVGQQSFEPERVDFMAPEASGRIGGVQAGFPLWSAVWTLGRMPEEWSDTWRAFFSGLRGQTRRFVGFPIDRLYPREYTDGFGAFVGFTGAASSWSESINADDDSELTLNGLPSGLVLSPGDYIGFTYTATEDAIAGLEWRALVRVVEGATASGGGAATVIVEPPVPSAVPSDAVAHLDNPGCTMTLILDQTDLGPVDRLYSIQGGQITAVQDLRA